jgi:hypothetical protein
MSQTGQSRRLGDVTFMSTYPRYRHDGAHREPRELRAYPRANVPINRSGGFDRH